MEELIQQIKTLEGSKGKLNTKPRAKELRKKLYDMFPKDKMWLNVGEWILEKSYNPVYDKEFITIFTKDGWNRREEYKRDKSLNWI